MRDEEIELLRAQLHEARDEAEPIEIAALSGLLARLEPGDPLLHQRVTLDPDALQDAAEDAVDALAKVDEDDDPAESWDALCALDELCAAATFTGQAPALLPFAEEAARLVRAFPEAWSSHAALATELLQERGPLPRDPARLLWAAVEGSRWRDGVVPAGLGAPDEARRMLGLPVCLSISEVRGLNSGLRLAAASAEDLPEPPPWRTLAKGKGWELAVGEVGGELSVVLSGVEGIFSRDDAPVQPTRDERVWRCPAVPGAWVVRVGERSIDFELAP